MVACVSTTVRSCVPARVSVAKRLRWEKHVKQGRDGLPCLLDANEARLGEVQRFNVN